MPPLGGEARSARGAPMTAQRYWAPAAWIEGGWRQSVVLEVDAQGRW